jgi:hypothetical protein
VGFRFSKSIKVIPGVRLNVSSRGVGVSAGVRGARVTVGPGGRVTRTLSIPGTGLSHTSTVSRPRGGGGGGGGGRGGGQSRRPAPPPAPRPPAPPKPGFLAPAAEKEFFAAVSAGGAGVAVDDAARPLHGLADVARRHGGGDAQLPLLCAALEGLWHVSRLDLDDEATRQRLTAPPPVDVPRTPDAARARHLLAWVVAAQTAASAAGPARGLAEHPYAQKYLQGRAWGVEITHGVSASLGLGEDVVHLAAAELHQAAGDLDTAIWTVEGVTGAGTPAALSLAELYSDADRHAEVRDLTNGVENVDDATALLLVFRARALAGLGYLDAARECLRDAMKARSRSSAVRHRALLERAEVNLASGRKAAARKDLETVLADDADYPGLREALDRLP